MKVLRRIYGLVIILRALLPILLLIAALAIAWRVLVEVRAAVAEPFERINENIDMMNDKLDEAAEGFETVGDGIAEVSGAVSQATGQVSSIAANLSINLDSVPVPDGFNTRRISVPGCCSFDLPTSIRTRNVNLDKLLPIPGLSQVKTFLSNTFGFFTEVNHILTGIVDLVSITQEMGEIIQAGKEAIDQMWDVFRKWGTVATVILILTVALMLTAYIEYLVVNLRRGWLFLMGKPAQ